MRRYRRHYNENTLHNDNDFNIEVNYESVLALHNATETIKTHSRLMSGYASVPYSTTKVDKRTVSIGNAGLTATYSPQSVILKGSRYAQNDSAGFGVYPKGIRRKHFVSPEKQYVVITTNGIQAFYLFPKDGLKLVKKNGIYTPVNAIQDYEITIDRTKANLARKESGVTEYIRTMWDMVPNYDSTEKRPDELYMPSDLILNERWFEWVRFCKYDVGSYNRHAKSLESTVQIVSKAIVDLAMAYQVEAVPTSRVSHNLHSDKVESLRERGLFKGLEGQ